MCGRGRRRQDCLAALCPPGAAGICVGQKLIAAALSAPRGCAERKQRRIDMALRASVFTRTLAEQRALSLFLRHRTLATIWNHRSGLGQTALVEAYRQLSLQKCAHGL